MVLLSTPLRPHTVVQRTPKTVFISPHLHRAPQDRVGSMKPDWCKLDSFRRALDGPEPQTHGGLACRVWAP